MAGGAMQVKNAVTAVGTSFAAKWSRHLNCQFEKPSGFIDSQWETRCRNEI
jgi:hypothetical protein